MFFHGATVSCNTVWLILAGVAECGKRSVAWGGVFRDVRPLPVSQALSIGAAGRWDALQTQALLTGRLHLCLQQLHQPTSSAAGETAHTNWRKGRGITLLICTCRVLFEGCPLIWYDFHLAICLTQNFLPYTPGMSD